MDAAYSLERILQRQKSNKSKSDLCKTMLNNRAYFGHVFIVKQT
jgi:hypothetical protein